MNTDNEKTNHYKKKADWHKKNASKMAEIANYKCQKCTRDADLKSGVIHHKQYTGNDYKKTLEKLIQTDAIEWLCKECHKFEHVAYTPDEVSFRMKHSGYCVCCNKFEWRSWFYNGNHTFSRNVFPLCKKCKKQLIDLGLMTVLSEEFQMVRLSDSFEKTPLNKQIMENIYQKMVSIDAYA